jgi:hypothetical protein
MEIIPFMPFSELEQAVVTHRFITELNERVKRPINLHKNVKRYIGHSQIVLFNSKIICNKIAEQEFDRDMGARSLKDAVKRTEIEFASAYKAMEKLVDEASNEGPLLKFDLVLKATSDDTVEFKVVKQGEDSAAIQQTDHGAEQMEITPSTPPPSPKNDAATPDGPGASKRKRENTPPQSPVAANTGVGEKQNTIGLRPRTGQGRFAKAAGV